MGKKRIDLQLAIADIVRRRYGVQVTTGDDNGLDIYVTWRNARKLLEDLEHLDGEAGTAAG